MSEFEHIVEGLEQAAEIAAGKVPLRVGVYLDVPAADSGAIVERVEENLWDWTYEPTLALINGKVTLAFSIPAGIPWDGNERILRRDVQDIVKVPIELIRVEVDTEAP